MLDQLNITKPRRRTKTRIKTLKDYLALSNGKEVFSFDNQKEADIFGNRLKEIARDEEGARTIFDLEEFDIQITNNTVRAQLVSEGSLVKKS